jgi:nucleotide-binding universal stress UspA family protein
MSDTASRASAAPTYIVGYDGGGAANAALGFARRLGRVDDARILAATVYGALPGAFMPYGSAQLYGKMESVLRERADELLARLDGAGVERWAVCASSTAGGLHDLARTEGASLIAVGVTHHRGVGALVPGGVADRLLHGTPCAVAVAPDGSATDSPIRVVAVAYDARDESRHALATASSLAERHGAQLVLIGAAGWTRADEILAGTDRERLHDAMCKRVAERLREAEAGLRVNVETRAVVVEGEPGPALVEGCRVNAEIDVLVMGSRAYGPLRSVLLGGVSRHVIDHAPCPVLVVPRGVSSELAGSSRTEAASPA